eukprot:SM000134S26956  [mRNA]  locus=s134:236179:237657:- [translate_table: standard]
MDSSGDIFDSSVDLEVQHLREGYEDGYRDGTEAGLLEGRDAGLRVGFQMGEELGFYLGCITVWTRASELEPGIFLPRAQRSIQQLGHLLETFPLLHPQDESIHDKLEVLRAKFRTIVSVLGVRPEYRGYLHSESAGETF